MTEKRERRKGRAVTLEVELAAIVALTEGKV